MAGAKRLIVGASIIVFSFAVHAQKADTDPLDDAMNDCFSGKAGETTSGMLDCTGKAAAGWDKRLNDAYGKLSKKLDPASRALLLTAQRSWLDFRKKDAEFSSGPWQSNTAKEQLTIALGHLDELRARTHAIEHYARGD